MSPPAVPAVEPARPLREDAARNRERLVQAVYAAEPDDVTAMLLGVFLSTAADDGPERVARLLDLVVDALRPPARR